MGKVLMISSGFTYRKINYGGVNKMFLWLGNALADSGYDVTFCCIHDKERSPSISCNAKSIELAVPSDYSFIIRHIVFLTCATKRIDKVLRKGKYDYVLIFDGMAFYSLLFLKLFHTFKYVVSERADPYYNQSFFERLKRMLYKYVDILVFQTDGAKQYFSSEIQKKAFVIPNPIEIPKDRWLSSNTYGNIAHVARLHIWQKRQDVLLKAFSVFLNNHPNFILNIYGGGPDDAKLHDLAVELNISPFVIFHGSTTNIKEELLKNDFFVLTSDFEGMPNALMEAMALGMPVISTKCSPGGAEALIDDKVNGLLVNCRDVNELAKAMSQMVDDSKLKVSLSDNARQSMENYNPSKIISLWRNIVV